MIQPYIDTDIEQLLTTFEDNGGRVKFYLYTIDSKENVYHKHLEVAKQTLIEVAKEINLYLDKIAAKDKLNREKLFTMDYDFTLLKSSGKEIDLETFMGWQYDAGAHSVLIQGLHSLFNEYFYYNTPEDSKHIVKREDENTIKGLAYAFLNPPYGFHINKNLYDTGAFFLNCCDTLFTDLSQIEVYEWSTDCSNYFDIGKDWWGTFFYTVYNPLRDCYIGIVASESD